MGTSTTTTATHTTGPPSATKPVRAKKACKQQGKSGSDAAECTKSKVSRKWTEEEQQSLLKAVEPYADDLDNINWADVAQSVPNRSGKQCREKWRNDLRPDINKDPWSKEEEWILAKMHSGVGNQWADIAKFLPGRAENAIKNHWNATLRSKAESKPPTILWVYGKALLANQGTNVTRETIFKNAQEQYKKLPKAEVPLEDCIVPDDFFLTKDSADANPGDAVEAAAAAPAAALPPAAPNPVQQQRQHNLGSHLARPAKKQCRRAGSSSDSSEDESNVDQRYAHGTADDEQPMDPVPTMVGADDDEGVFVVGEGSNSDASDCDRLQHVSRGSTPLLLHQDASRKRSTSGGSMQAPGDGSVAIKLSAVHPAKGHLEQKQQQGLNVQQSHVVALSGEPVVVPAVVSAVPAAVVCGEVQPTAVVVQPYAAAVFEEWNSKSAESYVEDNDTEELVGLLNMDFECTSFRDVMGPTATTVTTEPIPLTLVSSSQSSSEEPLVASTSYTIVTHTEHPRMVPTHSGLLHPCPPSYYVPPGSSGWHPEGPPPPYFSAECYPAPPEPYCGPGMPPPPQGPPPPHPHVYTPMPCWGPPPPHSIMPAGLYGHPHAHLHGTWMMPLPPPPHSARHGMATGAPHEMHHGHPAMCGPYPAYPPPPHPEYGPSSPRNVYESM